MAAQEDEAKGRVKRAAGELADDDQLKREGRVDQASGTLKRLIDRVKNTVTGRSGQ